MLEKFWDARTFRILFTALVFAIVLYFLQAARGTLALFLFAILFAYFLEPFVARLDKRLRNRLAAIAIVYAVFLTLLAGLATALGPRIASEARSLMVSLPQLADQVTSGQLIAQVGSHNGWSHQRQQQVQQFFLAHKADLARYASLGVSHLETPLSHLWWLILIPILAFFFLTDAPTIATGVVDLGRGHDEKGTLAGIVDDVNVMLGSYIRAQLLLAALTATILTAALALMRVPNAFVLGPVAGIFEFVPVVGPALASALIWGLAIVLGYPHIGWLFFVLGLWRVIQDYFNAPRIMGKSLEINPLATIFGVLAGGEIGGVIGALVAVPVLAILRILWRRLNLQETDNAHALPQLRASQLPDKPKA
jgi:predicted PurR-regulated permease PerM